LDTRRLRTARSNALAHGRFDVVRRIDTILRHRAQNPDAPHNPKGRPFKPYKASRNWHPAMRALWVKCNEEEITREELAKRTGYSIGVIYKWSLRPQVMSITRLIDMLHAVGLDLAAVTPTTVALDAHHPEVAEV
jgi:hypothetical protein